MRQADGIAVPQSTTFTWCLIFKAGSERPKYILVAFQAGKENDQPQNPSVFCHCNVQSISASLNDVHYPRTQYNLNIAQNQFAQAYGDVTKFRGIYTGMASELSHCKISPSEWKALHPFCVFDVSKQSERLEATTIDIKINVRIFQSLQANTQAYCLVISDRKLVMRSNGNRFNVIY